MRVYANEMTVHREYYEVDKYELTCIWESAETPSAANCWINGAPGNLIQGSI